MKIGTLMVLAAAGAALWLLVFRSGPSVGPSPSGPRPPATSPAARAPRPLPVPPPVSSERADPAARAATSSSMRGAEGSALLRASPASAGVAPGADRGTAFASKNTPGCRLLRANTTSSVEVVALPSPASSSGSADRNPECPGGYGRDGRTFHRQVLGEARSTTTYEIQGDW